MKEKGDQQEDPSNKGEHNRVDFPENKQQQQQQTQLEEQQKQEQLQEGQLRSDLSSQQKLEQRGKTKRSETKECITRSAAYPSQPQGEPDQLLRTRWCKTCWKKGRDTQACWHNSQQHQQHHKQKAWKQARKEQQQTAAASEHQLQTQACNNSLGIGEQEPGGSLEQQTLACRPPMQTWRILVDTGAELSVALRSFASHIQLSPLEEDLELWTASGIAIQTFGIRTVQLLSQGFSFNMSFVVAEVEQPLLGLSSLLRENLSLHLDSNLGHHLGNTAGEKTQLEQRGQQIYLVACPTELGLTQCMTGNLLDSSLSPEAKNLGHEVTLDFGRDKEVLDKGGATSFSLGLKQQKHDKNKSAIRQQPALPKTLRQQKQKGQLEAVSKLRTQQKTRFIEKMQLALLE